MVRKLRVGILGATGAVGQNYVLLLENHPWFEVTYLAASSKSAGKSYAEAVRDKWYMNKDLPSKLADILVRDASSVESAADACDFVFSSYEGSKEDIQRAEESYAEHGIPVVSNNSAHRWTLDVPMIIPEINAAHIKAIDIQRSKRGWEKGFIVTKPNCSIQSYMAPLYALMQAGYMPQRMIVSTEQALSGAGFPGVPSLAIGDNVVPYISGEDEKSEKEPLKIFGQLGPEGIHNYEGLSISATCTRVPVRDGHLALVNVEFGENKPGLEEIIQLWRDFRAKNLPSAPKRPIIYRTEVDRPQPIKDRDAENGMAVIVGRLRKCNVFDYKFVGLSHNTIRGAAGGAILTAELLYNQYYL